MTWTALKQTVPSELASTLNSASQTVKGVIDTVDTLLSTLKKILELVLNLAVDISDPSALAIRALTEAALAILDDIENNARSIYALPVMPVDQNQYVGDTGAIQGLIGNSMLLSDGTRIQLEGNGGNAGFIRTVAASFEDSLDENRPRFDEDATVGGAVLVAGADTYYRAIALIKKLQDMFSSPPYPVLSIDDNSLPTPRDVRVVPIAPLGRNFYGVKLSWAPEPVATVLSLYGNPKYDIREIVIYRSGWDITLPRNDYARYEVDRLPFTGLETSWYDTNFPSELTSPGWTYYAVGFALNQVHPDGTITELPEPLSIRRVPICLGPGGARPAKNMGIAPDWVNVDLFELIPPIGQALANIRQFLEDMQASVDTANSQIKDIIELLAKELQRYSDFADKLSAILKELIDLLTFPEGYFGITLIGPLSGGNEAFAQAVKDALTDTSDSSRPTFDKGTEIVAGVVLMAGVTKSSGAGALQALLSTLGAIFGGVADEGASVARDIIAASEAAEEQICLNDALIKKICEEIEDPPGAGFLDNLEPFSS